MGEREVWTLLFLAFAWPFAVFRINNSTLALGAREALGSQPDTIPATAKLRRTRVSLVRAAGSAVTRANNDGQGVVVPSWHDAPASARHGAAGNDDDGKKRIIAFIGVQTGFQSHGDSQKVRPDQYNYELRRQVLRQTWFPADETEMRRQLSVHGYVMRFVIGQTDNTTAEERLHEEIRNYGPMLRLDVTESYKNLAWKSHHFFLAVHRYYNADYVVKIDDDVYLRPDRLMAGIRQYTANKQDYIGCMTQGTIVRNATRKWFEPQHARLGDGNYFTHALGPLYILSGRAIDLVASLPMHNLRHFINEDVTVGGWMMMLDLKEYDDRRLCTPGCNPISIGVYPIDRCAGLCDPVRNLPYLHGHPNCQTPTIPHPHHQLPNYKPLVDMEEVDK